MYYLLFNNNGILETRYTKEYHGDGIPKNAVEVEEAFFNKTISEADGVWKFNADKTITKHEIPPPIVTPEQIALAVEFARHRAYAQESDPLFFKFQRGTATKEEWTAKVDEIKARYPDGVMPK